MEKNNLNNFIKNCGSLKQICQPLFHSLNLKGFSYQRMYKDGSRVFFCDSEAWAENFLLNNYFLYSGYKKFSQLPTFTLCNHWPKEDVAINALLRDGREHFGYDNGFLFLDKHEDFIDAFTLRGSREDDYINHIYINNIPCIKKFANYFTVKASSLITEAEKNKFFFEENRICSRIDNIGNKLKENLEINEFNEIPNDRIFIAVPDRTFLSKRETECLINNIKGKSAKQISRMLSISHRTVESYLENIKNYLNMKNRGEVFDYVLSFEHNRRLIYSPSA